MSRGWRVALVVLLQTAALVYMIGARQWTLATGAPVVLETEPVDPRSLFSGDYVRLNYKISRLHLDQVGGDRDFKRHERVYVLLQARDPYWEAVSLHRDHPATASGQVAIRGEVTEVARGFWNAQTRKWEERPTGVLHLRYGIESYFVPEGEGRALERPQPNERISIRVAVDRFGRAGIQAVLVNGREQYVERLF